MAAAVASETGRQALLTVCALGLCVFSGLAVARAARLAAAADSPTTDVSPGALRERGPEDSGDAADPRGSAGLVRRLARVSRSVGRAHVGSSQRAPAAAAGSGPGPLDGAGGTRPSDRLQDVFISVKTSAQFHSTRLPPVLDTWFSLASNQTWFFTDVDDPELQDRTGGHVINTNCSSSHHREALCCKMAAEYDFFMASGKKWFCHFDDDNYVNTARLAELLSGHSARQDRYLGKNSVRAPLQILDRVRHGERIAFWFATGGAGFCLSRSLALKMSPFAGGGRFMRVGEKIRLPDDVTVGYIVEHLLKVPLTVVDGFHSHLEQMKFMRASDISRQISFSYSRSENETNVLNLNTFDDQRDPTRFYSLHCLLQPSASFCAS